MLGNLLTLLFPVILGLPFFWRIIQPKFWIERLALSFLVGVILSSVALVIWGLVDFPYYESPLLFTYIVWVLITIGLVLYSNNQLADNNDRQKIHWVTQLFIGLTVLNLATATIHTMAVPISNWDVLAFWLPKASAIFPPHTLKALATTVYPDYPPLWPLNMFLVRMFAPSANAVKILPIVYTLAMLIIVYGYLKAYSSPFTAAVTTWVISGIPYLFNDYGLFDLMAHIPFMVFTVTSTVMMARYISHSRDTSSWLLAMVFSGATSLTRPEGFQHALIITSVITSVSFLRREWSRCVFGWMITLLPYIGWQLIVKIVFHHPGTYVLDDHRLLESLQIVNVVTVMKYGLREIFNPFIFGPSMIAVVILFANWKNWRKTLPFFGVFVLDVLAIMLTYLIMPATNNQPLSWWLQTGFKRLSLHFVPLLYIGTALGAADILLNRSTLILSPSTENSWSIKFEKLIQEDNNLVGSRLQGYGERMVYISLAGLLTIIAAYTYVGEYTPHTLDLVDVHPSNISNLYQPISYGFDNNTWWKDQSRGSSSALMTHPNKSGLAVASFDMLNIGFRKQNDSNLQFRNDNIYGRFSNFTATVGLVNTTAGSVRFLVLADGKVLAATDRLTGTDTLVRLTVSIPPYTRLVELAVDPIDDNNSDHAVWFDPRLLRTDASWLVALCLLIGAILMAVRGVTGYIFVLNWKQHYIRIDSSGGIALMLLAGVLIQQADALFARVLPLWF